MTSGDSLSKTFKLYEEYALQHNAIAKDWFDLFDEWLGSHEYHLGMDASKAENGDYSAVSIMKDGQIICVGTGRTIEQAIKKATRGVITDDGFNLGKIYKWCIRHGDVKL